MDDGKGTEWPSASRPASDMIETPIMRDMPNLDFVLSL